MTSRTGGRFGLVALGASVGMALAVTGAQAQSAGVNVFEKILGFGSDAPNINYSERAPLVIPPQRTNLPAPQDGSAVTADPSWPRDPDVAKRAQAAAEAGEPQRGPGESPYYDRLQPGTADPGQLPGGQSLDQRTGIQIQREEEHASVVVNPSVLRPRPNFGNSEEAPLVVGAEPPRRSLIDPPAGLRVPSGAAPLNDDDKLPSELQADANKPWYQKIFR